MCQNYNYISKEWWYLSNQEQLRIEKPKWKSTRVLSKYFQTIRKWVSRYVDNTRRLWKITEWCRKAREYIKVSLIIYLDGWEY